MTSTATAWDVYRNGRRIETVYYTPGISAEEVRRGLIDHDGMPADIVVRPGSFPDVRGRRGPLWSS